MARSYASTVIAAPADEVWARIRDFNGLPVWLGGLVVESEIEDGKAGDQDGGVRSFTLGDGTHIRRRAAADDLRLRPRRQIGQWEGFFANEIFQGGFDALKAHFAG